MSTPTVPAPLAGKVALITGGSRGIGRGIALHFASKGVAKIAITYASNSTAAEECLGLIRKINPNIQTTAINADVLSPTFAQDTVAQTLKGLSTENIDIVVSNAPYINADPEEALPIAILKKEFFDKLMTGNAWAPTQLFLATLPHFPRGGRMIMIGSTTSKSANNDPIVVYGASKAALDSFTRSLALMYSAKHGITINSVSVGITKTDLVTTAMENGALPPEFIKDLAAKHTADSRIGEVEDIAGIVGFLASEESRWINGESCNNIRRWTEGSGHTNVPRQVITYPQMEDHCSKPKVDAKTWCRETLGCIVLAETKGNLEKKNNSQSSEKHIM